MALTATLYRFELEISDVDRGVYTSHAMRVAQHPSESLVYMVARVLAYGLNLDEGLSFAKGGLSNPDEPALSVDDLTGARQLWIDIGLPSADRLHRASKAADRVRVYVHKPAEPWIDQLRSATIHQPETVEIFALDPSFLDALAAEVGRVNAWALVHTEGVLYVTPSGGETVEGRLTRLPLD